MYNNNNKDELRTCSTIQDFQDDVGDMRNYISFFVYWLWTAGISFIHTVRESLLTSSFTFCFIDIGAFSQKALSKSKGTC